MKHTVAVLLIPLGIILAVALPIVISVAFDVDLGQKPGILVATMMPGIIVIAFARQFRRASEAQNPAPQEILPGHRLCELCRKVVPESEGAEQTLHTPMAKTTFVCRACTRYRTKRALTVLVVFLAFLGVLALVVTLLVPKNNNKKAELRGNTEEHFAAAQTAAELVRVRTQQTKS
jgi:hypothetical protein